MQTPAQQLLAAIDRFCQRHEMNVTAFGRDAMGDPQFVHDLRKGRQPRLDTAMKVNRYMEGKDAAAILE